MLSSSGAGGLVSVHSFFSQDAQPRFVCASPPQKSRYTVTGTGVLMRHMTSLAGQSLSALEASEARR